MEHFRSTNSHQLSLLLRITLEDVAMGDNSISLSFSSLLIVLLLASKASPSPHPSNISASASAAAAAASSSFLPCNRSRGLPGSRLITDDLGLEHLIDSPHIPSRILTDSSSVIASTANPNAARCGRTSASKPYGPCTPEQNERPANCCVYNRALLNTVKDPSIMRIQAVPGSAMPRPF
ncbi:hypothetical protein ACJRO7_016674 [Eucalyptus globulus]|uniref:Uncharacterized protein n=1 Tax=Eucalyptus globulus TaxID=34317 RepID=A0ABD3L7S5_EUCGL